MLVAVFSECRVQNDCIISESARASKEKAMTFSQVLS
jgi:hypothetical protein